MSDLTNPRAVVGDNKSPDYARQITERMRRDYSALFENAESLEAEGAAEAKNPVTSDDVALEKGRLVKRIREFDHRVEAYRVAEKEPFRVQAETIDALFFSVRDRLGRRKKTDKPGIGDVLQNQIDEYLEAKRLAEQRLRQQQEREAREREEAAARERAEAERKQREAEAAAARARKPENVAAHEDAARAAEQAAATAAADQEAARALRLDAQAAAASKPADMVRTRGDDGVMLTMKQVPFVQIVDSMKLDAVALWPFVKDAHKQMALEAWAKVTQHKRPMDGAIIEMRNKGVTR